MKASEVLRMAQDAIRIQWFGREGPNLVGFIARLAELPGTTEVPGCFVLIPDGTLMAGKAPAVLPEHGSMLPSVWEHGSVLPEHIEIVLPGLSNCTQLPKKFHRSINRWDPPSDRPAGVCFIGRRDNPENGIEVGKPCPITVPPVAPMPDKVATAVGALPRTARIAVMGVWNRRMRCVRIRTARR